MLRSGNVSRGTINSCIRDSLGLMWVGDRLFGQPPDKTGVTDTYSYFAALITAIGSDDTTLVIPKGTYRINSDLTFPANIFLAFRRGAKIKPMTIAGTGTLSNVNVSGGSSRITTTGTTFSLTAGYPSVECGMFIESGGERREVKDWAVSGTTITGTLWTAFSSDLSSAVYEVSSRTFSCSVDHGLECGDRIVVGSSYFFVLKKPASNSISVDRHPQAVFSAQSYTRSVRVKMGSNVKAGRYQIFDPSGGGVVKFGRPGLGYVYPEWWGAIGDADAANAEANSNAFEAAMWCWQEDTTPPYTYKGRILLGNARYVLARTLLWNGSVSMRGVGNSADAREGTIIIQANNVNRHLAEDLPQTGLSEFTEIENIRFMSGVQTAETNGIHFTKNQHGWLIRHCRFDGWNVGDTCFAINVTLNGHIHRTAITNAASCVKLGTDSTVSLCDLSPMRLYGLRVDGGGDLRAFGNKIFADSPTAGYELTVTGISLGAGSGLINDNVIDHCGRGIDLSGFYGVVSDNSIPYSRGPGIRFSGACGPARVVNNHVYRCGTGVDKSISATSDNQPVVEFAATTYNGGEFAYNHFYDLGGGYCSIPATWNTPSGAYQPMLVHDNYGIDLNPENGSWGVRNYKYLSLEVNSKRPLTGIASRFQSANTAATTIDTLPGVTNGKQLSIHLRDVNTTIAEFAGYNASGQSQMLIKTWNGAAGWVDVFSSTSFNYFRTSAGGAVSGNGTVADQIYFGVREQKAADSSIVGKWSGVCLNVGTAFAADSETIAWEYWNGSTWASLTTSLGAGSDVFKSTGIQKMYFTPPYDWAKTTIPAASDVPSGGPNYSYFWIRARLSAASNITSGGQQSTDVPKCKILGLNPSLGDLGPLLPGQRGQIVFEGVDGQWTEISRSIEPRLAVVKPPSYDRQWFQRIVTLIGGQGDESPTGAGGATISADTTNYKMGSQGWRMTMAASGTGQLIFDPVGVAGVDDPAKFPPASAIGIWVFLSDHTKVTSVTINVISNEALTQSSTFTWTVAAGQLTTGWNFCRAPAVAADLAGWGTIYRIRVLLVVTGATFATVGQIWVECPSKARILIINDGGYQGFVTSCYPGLVQLGIPVTFAIDPAILGTGTAPDNRFTEARLMSLAKENNNDVSFHGYDGSPTSGMTEAEIVADTMKAIKWLQRRGFYTDRLWRAAWVQNQATNHAAAQKFVVAYASPNSSANIHCWPPISKWNIPRLGLHTLSTGQMDTYFDNLRKTNSIMVCYLHSIDAGGGNNITPTNWAYFLAKLTAAIAGGWMEGVTFASLSNAVDIEAPTTVAFNPYLTLGLP